MFEVRLLIISLVCGYSVGHSEPDYRLKRDVKSDFYIPTYCNFPLGMESGHIRNDMINASSYFVFHDVFMPHQARLNGLSAWSSLKSDAFQILEINLGDSHLISGISTQGRHIYGEWVTSYAISYKTNNTGDWVFILDDRGFPIHFSGNDDSRTIHTNYFKKNIVAKRIRIHPKSWIGWVSMRVELLGCLTASECRYPLGMENGRLADRQITASTYYDERYAPRRARLNGFSAWSSKTLDDFQFLEIFIGGPQIVSGIVTQGRKSSKEWVTSFTVSYRNAESKSWLEILSDKNVPMKFPGNLDSDTIKYNFFPKTIVATRIRILPKKWTGWISMRVEVLGCFRESICTYPLGIENGDITNDQIIASTYNEYTAKCGPPNARLNGVSSWCSYILDTSQFLEVRLCKPYSISGISTQGRPDAQEWVSSFTVSYRHDASNTWSHIVDSNGDRKIFLGNEDKTSIKTNYFDESVVTTRIRIHPKTWNQWISMRIELYGCLKDIYE